MKNPKAVLSLDAILFVTLAINYLINTSTKIANIIFISIIIFCLFIYLIVDHASKVRPNRITLKLKTLTFLGIVFLLIYVPALGLIITRQKGLDPVLTVDGAIMTEEAAKRLLEFKNPYAISYQEVLKNWPYDVGGVTTNPTYDHYPYLPTIVAINAIFYGVLQPIFGFFDTRFVSLLFLTATIILIFKYTRLPQNKLLFATVFLFNPIFISSFLWGLNDIYLLFFILMTAYLLKAKKFVHALIALALACSIKIFAWLLAPFVILYLYHVKKTNRSGKISFLTKFAQPGLFVFATLTLPFFLTSPKDFLEDIFVYSSSFTTIGGFGFSELLYQFGAISNRNSTIPFEIIQILVGIPLLLVLFYLQNKNNTIGQVLINYSILLLPMLYFARNLNHNYLAYFAQIVIITFFVSSEEFS